MQQPPHLSAPVTSCIPLPGPGGADSQCPAQPCCCQEVPALLPETPGLAQPLCQQLEGWAEPCQPLFQLQFRWSQRVIFILILPIPLTVILPTAQAVAKVPLQMFPQLLLPLQLWVVWQVSGQVLILIINILLLVQVHIPQPVPLPLTPQEE